MDSGSYPAAGDDFTDKEYEAAFAVAKLALGMVGRFRTPPTPEVYEFWYRYVEGHNAELNRRVGFLVDEVKSANRQQIQDLRQQFLMPSQTSRVDDVTTDLLSSMAGLNGIMDAQASAGSEFDRSLLSISDRLAAEPASEDLVRSCVKQITQSNAQMRQQLESLQGELKESQRQIRQLNDDLFESQRSLMTDPLTGIGNRRMFDSLLRKELVHVDRQRRQSFLMLIDLDNFKQINDQFGHDSGDAVVKHVAEELRRLAGEGHVARFGGDEFGVFGIAHDGDAGKALAEEIAQTVFAMSLKVRHSGQSLGRLSVSIGVAALRPVDDCKTWFERADRMLYAAKNAGRNSVRVDRG